jgi:hypothetical protein
MYDPRVPLQLVSQSVSQSISQSVSLSVSQSSVRQVSCRSVIQGIVGVLPTVKRPAVGGAEVENQMRMKDGSN